MSKKPTIKNLKLPSCCVKPLRRINSKLESGRWIKKLLPISPFVILFSSLGRGGSGKNVLPVVHFSETHWDILAEALVAVNIITKESCKKEAALHALKHSGGEVGQFWEALRESFM